MNLIMIKNKNKKRETSFQEVSKFERIVHINKFDNTAKNKAKIQHCLFLPLKTRIFKELPYSH